VLRLVFAMRAERMQGYANDRGFGPLLDDGAAAPSEGAGVAARGAPQLERAGRWKLRAAREMLDGIGGLGWSVLGFVGGAVFWHFVGFWGFVSDVVLADGPPMIAGQAVIYAPPPEVRARWLQVADASAPSCTLLSLDRRTGVTSARPCDGEHAPLPADSFQGREDRVITRETDDRTPPAVDD
jgi:hypothetical protein